VWNVVPFILLLAVCPLAMLLMMRGMHGGMDHDTTARDARIAELEAQVASLRQGERPAVLPNGAAQESTSMREASVTVMPPPSTEASATAGGR
jgi:hypothetical protein